MKLVNAKKVMSERLTYNLQVIKRQVPGYSRAIRCACGHFLNDHYSSVTDPPDRCKFCDCTCSPDEVLLNSIVELERAGIKIIYRVNEKGRPIITTVWS